MVAETGGVAIEACERTLFQVPQADFRLRDDSGRGADFLGREQSRDRGRLRNDARAADLLRAAGR